MKNNTQNTYEDAIKIVASNSLEGITSEYRHIQSLHDKKDVSWTLKSQKLIRDGKKYYDDMIVELKDGSEKMESSFLNWIPFFSTLNFFKTPAES